MDLGLKGKTALVSGGSKGIGRAIAEELAKEGARVAVAARGQAAIDEAVAAIRDAGGEAIGVSADMYQADGVAKAVEATRSAFGPIDIAVTNVDAPDARRGSSFRVGLEDTTDEDFEQAFDQLVMSVVYLSRAVIPDMKERRWGRLLNVGSKSMKHPHAPPTQKILSNVGRLGVVGLMKTLSLEYGAWNITANIVATGQFATDLAREAFAARGRTFEQQEAIMRETGMGACRFGRPEELAAVAAFLCSERASYVSGETIAITGGMHKAVF
jgi:3-oxoacyl-[acyl-carrier protein] reductase